MAMEPLMRATFSASLSNCVAEFDASPIAVARGANTV